MLHTKNMLSQLIIAADTLNVFDGLLTMATHDDLATLFSRNLSLNPYVTPPEEAKPRSPIRLFHLSALPSTLHILLLNNHRDQLRNPLEPTS